MGKKFKYTVITGGALSLSWVILQVFVVDPTVAAKPPRARALAARTGTLVFDFDRAALDRLGLNFIADGNLEEIPDGNRATFAVEESSTLRVVTQDGVFQRFAPGVLPARGAFLVTRPGHRRVIGDLALTADDQGVWTIRATLDSQVRHFRVFDLSTAMVDFDAAAGRLGLIAELTITTEWAEALAAPEAAGAVVGALWVQTLAGPPRETRSSDDNENTDDSEAWLSDRQEATTVGPDVIVADLQSIARFFREGDITAYAIGTHACNLGDVRANWFAHTNEHPVIVQNMYRLKDEKFEQIGLSWVKHGFYAVSMSLCGPCYDPTDGSQLGVGCSDPYSASLNGVQNNMSPTSTVNAHTGYFPYPWSGWSGPPPSSDVERRLQVHDADLDPDLNPGARYVVQGHYVTPGDARAHTHDNNASYREVFVSESSNNIYSVTVSGSKPTHRGAPAVRAWQDFDPEVVETNIRVPNEGLFILAGKAIDLGGLWRYSYALENLNSDRSARSFSLPLPPGAVVTNVGFHDVDYHSGEPYVGTDWPGVVTSDSITWATQIFDQNPNANALRFGTVYSFWFDINVEPGMTNVTIELFKHGLPEEVTANIFGPKVMFIDCNNNELTDACDIDCAAVIDPPMACVDLPGGDACGMSQDCNDNGVPDECEPDCNGNGIADGCDLAAGTSVDCNGNRVPDDCEPDCNDNDVADDCEVLPDTDGDGTDNCSDLCPETTPANTCNCPDYGQCCFPPELGGQCIGPITPAQCINFGGTPECMPQPCRQGCLIGDYEGDGDLDLCDATAYQQCISLDASEPGYVAPPHECSIPLDFDGDDDVDMEDLHEFRMLLTGPQP